MRVTGKKLALLSGALAVCLLLLALLAGGREDAPETEGRCYFTNYASPENLLAISVENNQGSIVLARVNGGYQALGNFPVQGDEAEIADFFAQVCCLPLSHLVEGASASDGQYGLTEPQAEVLIQDGEQGGVLFYLGGPVPGGKGYYACLSGDDRVFVLENVYAQLFLSNVERFLDLRPYPSLDGPAIAELSGIELLRGSETVCCLRQAAAINGETVYFSMEFPWRLLLGAEPVKNALLTPLRQLRGIRILEGDTAAVPMSESFRLSFRDGSVITVLTGPRDGEYTAVTAEGSGVVLQVPSASLAFMDAAAEDILGGVLLKLNLNDIQSLTLNQRTYEIQSSAGQPQIIRDGQTFDAAVFQNTVLPALNHISIGGSWDGTAANEELLRLRIVSSVTEETIQLVFCRLDERRCAVEINGQPAVWCDLAAVSVLLDAAD